MANANAWTIDSRERNPEILEDETLPVEQRSRWVATAVGKLVTFSTDGEWMAAHIKHWSAVRRSTGVALYDVNELRTHAALGAHWVLRPLVRIQSEFDVRMCCMCVIVEDDSSGDSSGGDGNDELGGDVRVVCGGLKLGSVVLSASLLSGLRRQRAEDAESEVLQVTFKEEAAVLGDSMAVAMETLSDPRFVLVAALTRTEHRELIVPQNNRMCRDWHVQLQVHRLQGGAVHGVQVGCVYMAEKMAWDVVPARDGVVMSRDDDELGVYHEYRFVFPGRDDDDGVPEVQHVRSISVRESPVVDLPFMLVESLVLSPDGKTMALCVPTGTTYLVEIETGNVLSMMTAERRDTAQDTADLEVGQICDVRDSYGDFYEAEATLVSEDRVRFHFINWRAVYDEVVPRGPRIVPRGTRTFGPHLPHYHRTGAFSAHGGLLIETTSLCGFPQAWNWRVPLRHDLAFDRDRRERELFGLVMNPRRDYLAVVDGTNQRVRLYYMGAVDPEVALGLLLGMRSEESELKKSFFENELYDKNMLRLIFALVSGRPFGGL